MGNNYSYLIKSQLSWNDVILSRKSSRPPRSPYRTREQVDLDILRIINEIRPLIENDSLKLGEIGRLVEGRECDITKALKILKAKKFKYDPLRDYKKGRIGKGCLYTLGTIPAIPAAPVEPPKAVNRKRPGRKSNEFKREAVKRAKEIGAFAVSMSRDIPLKTLNKWILYT